MIIGLKISNWKSFAEETVFSPVTSGKRHLERVPQLSVRPSLRLSPIAVLYGGNASGKTNFISFLRYLQKLVCSPLPDEMDKAFIFHDWNKFNASEVPLSFELTFLAYDVKKECDGGMYVYSAKILPNRFIMEKLETIDKNASTTTIFERNEDIITFGSLLNTNNPQADALRTLINPNQSFLGKGGRKLLALAPAYNWFVNQLMVLDGDTSRVNSWYPNDENRLRASRWLSSYDTGVSELFWEDISFAELPNEIQQHIEKNAIADNQPVEYSGNRGNHYIVSLSEGRNKIQRLSTRHCSGVKGKSLDFGMNNEAYGTQRMVELIPAFSELCSAKSRKVVVIDEFDKSWHYMLSRRMLQEYLASCNCESRCQLIVTTHDLMLMGQELYRLDEIWLTTREENGQSTLTTLGGSGIRYDKDIRKMYLEGRLRGVPRLDCGIAFNSEG